MSKPEKRLNGTETAALFLSRVIESSDITGREAARLEPYQSSYSRAGNLVDWLYRKGMIESSIPNDPYGGKLSPTDEGTEWLRRVEARKKKEG